MSDLGLALAAYAVTVTVFVGYARLRWLAGHPDRLCHWCDGTGCIICGTTGRRRRPGARLAQRLFRKEPPRGA